MKYKYFILFLIVVGLFSLAGCAKNITQAEAGGIATAYIIENVGLGNEAIEIHDITLKSDGWYVQLLIGDDQGTIILDEKGNFVRLEAYKWV